MPAKSGPNSSDNKGKKERILIFSAGANIHNTYRSSYNKILPTKVYVLAEKAVFDDSNDVSDFFKEERPKIRNAIKQLERKVKDDKKDFVQPIILPELDQDSIRDAVFDIYHDNPDAEYLFNVTAGTALFSVSMFIAAIWIGGRVCITRSPDDDDYIELSIPKMSVKDLTDDPKLKTIIQILGKAVKDRNRGDDDGWLYNKELLQNMGVLEENDMRQLTGDQKVKQSRRMGKLIESALVEERGKGREKQYRLTQDGIFCYKFIEKSDEKSDD